MRDRLELARNLRRLEQCAADVALSLIELDEDDRQQMLDAWRPKGISSIRWAAWFAECLLSWPGGTDEQVSADDLHQAIVDWCRRT